MPLDNTLPVSPKHAGHSLPNKFIMDICVYNQTLNSNTHHVTWKAMALALLDAIMRKIAVIYDFFMAAIRILPKLCMSGIRRSRIFCIYAIRQPHHCVGKIVINYYQIITFITVRHLIFIHFEMVAIAVSVGLCL